MTAPRIYLDSNATTPVLPAVREAVAGALGLHGNPSSLHAAGRDAARVLSASRGAVAAWLGAAQREVVFTSGGTEALRLGVLGALAARGARRHVVASAIEHSAVLDLLRALAADGVTTTWVRPGRDGGVAAEDVAAAIRDDTALVAVMWASNETGVLQPVAEIAATCAARGVPYLCDAVQAAGKLPIDLGTMARAGTAPSLVAVSAHKFHGPRGVGALLVSEAARAAGLWRAPWPATHEGGRRAGTEPLPLIAGFAAAADAARALTSDDFARIAALRDRLEAALVGGAGAVVNGAGERVPNTTNLSFPGADAERLLALLDRAGVDASGGSACHAGSPEPSHVLTAMGIGDREARTALRFSLSRLTTREEIDAAIAAVLENVEVVRASARTGARRAP